MAHQRLALITLVVKDYDEAIDFYVHKLHFKLVEDTALSDNKRWVRVQPPGGTDGPCLLLAKAKSDAELQAVGNQTGGRVFLFLHTVDIVRDLALFQQNQVEIVRGPDTHAYGTVAVFKDLYGNQFDLIQPSS
jgi:catechol 2,3-dioxygenase-like lactoylglutathione lyase family enzyme